MIDAVFWSLALAAVCLWLPRDLRTPLDRLLVLGPTRVSLRLWMIPAMAAAMFAAAAGFIDARGLAALVVLATAGHAANHASGAVRPAAHLVVLGLCAGLFLHVVPGFANPKLLDGVVLGPGALPYTQYLNVDKGLAGLLLLGGYVPDRIDRDQGHRRVTDFVWRFLLLVVAVMALSLLLGYVRWDPKRPEWWPMWMGVMLVLTALPEEAAFRGVIHTWLAERRGDPASVLAIVLGGLAFGLAHAAGGPLYVAVASVAGIGYGWIYASTRSIGAAILAHAGLNTIHFLLFTYPALAPAP